MPDYFTDQYGNRWNQKPEPIQSELLMIQRLYFGADKSALLKHYLGAHKLLWPEDKQHRWFVLGLKSEVENKITVLMGPASSNKTYVMSAHALIDFFAFPDTSFSLISTDTLASLENKIWGRGIKWLFNRAKQRYDWLPGFALESQRRIVPDDIDPDSELARELNKGIVCVPCVAGGRFVGMGRFQGVKPPNTPGKNDGILKHYGDEAAIMKTSFLDAYTNWMVSPNFKGIISGNPTDISDPLCIAAEPPGGWDAFVDTGKTQEWNSTWYNAHVVAYDGRDTPNNDAGTKLPFLIAPEFIENLRVTHGEDSWQLYQQGIGKPSRGMVSNRVITIGLCQRNKAFEDVVWRDGELLHLYACDPAFGGVDRCVAGKLTIGHDVAGKQILSVSQPEIVPIRLNCGLEPEEQIAIFLKRKSEELGIPPERMFYDSFGGGLLGFAFSKPQMFGERCPVPVNSGDRPTTRPVRFDEFVIEPKGTRRLKRCDEAYSKFVTEMWYSTREAIESQQVRNLPRNVADEGQMRMFKIVSGNRVEVESKEEMKERIRKSPDLYDWFAIGVEGSRRLGFKIQRIGVELAAKKKPDWLERHASEYQAMLRERQLQNA